MSYGKKIFCHTGLLIVGASRRDLPKEVWLNKLGNYPEEFCHWLDFRCCDFDNQQSLSILHDESADTTYFLSVPPERYENAIINLKEAGFLDDPERSRVVIEKPFGHNLESANHLQSVVGRHLREKQVYRIDHYLGKDTVNNILATRFGNILLEPLWNREYIEEVQIFATETIGCEGRSQYYDGCWCCKRHAAEPYASGSFSDCHGSTMQNDATEIQKREDKGSCRH
ncbi:MAG: hypothetical protein CM15mV24_0810 [Bellamyvirus sp.]|nr:MAG: hypothetical protein CM15mV24_0810 [Bellamyvirus sp.]